MVRYRHNVTVLRSLRVSASPAVIEYEYTTSDAAESGWIDADKVGVDTVGVLLVVENWSAEATPTELRVNPNSANTEATTPSRCHPIT